MIQGFVPPFRKVRQFHLDEFQPSPFLGINNITVPVKKDGRWDWWLTAEETSYENASTAYFNDSSDNSILDAEGNACGIIFIPSIESTFDNDHIHVFNDLKSDTYTDTWYQSW